MKDKERLDRFLKEGNNMYDFENMDKLEEQFVEDSALDCIAHLSKKDKTFILEHPDPFEHHFGLGMYIRNKYIHGKELPFPIFMADDLSSTIVERIIKKLQEE